MTDREIMQIALEALENGVDHLSFLQREKAITALRERLEQPTVKESLQVEQPQQGEEYRRGWNDAMLRFCVQPQQYERNNPLGGPAKVFDAMADAIRAGDSYESVLRHYRYMEQPTSQELAAGAFYPQVTGYGKPQQGQNLYGSDKTSTLSVDSQKTSTQQEPVGYMNAGHVYEFEQKRLDYGYVYPLKKTGASIPLYTAPQRREWRGLTEEDIERAKRECDWVRYPDAFARAIEANLKDRNA